jgi:hypothetical protein
MQMWEWVLEGILVLEVILAGIWRVLALNLSSFTGKTHRLLPSISAINGCHS